MTTRYLVATTPVEVITMVAAARSGALDAGDRRVLVVGRGHGSAAARRAAEELAFVEQVVVLDELLDTPGRIEDSSVELVVGTASLEAGRALARRLPDLTITLVAVDAAVHGPTPHAVRGRFARLTHRVLHLDLVPGLAPLLLAERQVPARAVPLEDYRSVVASLAPPGPVTDPTTLVVGRADAWAGALDADSQADLLVAMVQRCAEAGHSRIVILLEPDTRQRVRRQLDKAAMEVRADLTVVDDCGPVEAWCATGAVRLVVGCATADLLVARAVHGCRVAQLDSHAVLKRLDPFSDPRRIPGTLVSATVPDLRSWTATPEGAAPAPVDLPGLAAAVSYAMQPELLAGHRADAIQLLASTPDGLRRRFIRRRRLTELRLPGGKRKVRARLD